jgi:hypothetical protein
MNEYLPLIMAAAFVGVLSVAIKLITRTTAPKDRQAQDPNQRELDFSRTKSPSERQSDIVAGARSR